MTQTGFLGCNTSWFINLGLGLNLGSVASQAIMSLTDIIFSVSLTAVSVKGITMLNYPKKIRFLLTFSLFKSNTMSMNCETFFVSFSSSLLSSPTCITLY